jgi:hypothetical protein
MEGAMSFTGSEDHSISLEDAAALTKNYRNASESGAIIAEFFGKEALEGILAQERCVGIRCYYGKKDDGSPALVLVGADANENDLLDEDKIVQAGDPCPPFCASSNKLNS